MPCEHVIGPPWAGCSECDRLDAEALRAHIADLDKKLHDLVTAIDPPTDEKGATRLHWYGEALIEAKRLREAEKSAKEADEALFVLKTQAHEVKRRAEYWEKESRQLNETACKDVARAEAAERVVEATRGPVCGDKEYNREGLRHTLVEYDKAKKE